MSSPYALVNTSNVVINMVQWDGVTTFNAAPNTLVLATGQPNAQIGGTYVGGVFTAPAAPTTPQGIIFQNSPTSGATVPLPNAPQPQASLNVYLQPAAPLAALTLNFPPSPRDNDKLALYTTQAITALTCVPQQGATIPNAPTTLAAGVAGIQSFTWSQQLGLWFQF